MRFTNNRKTKNISTKTQDLSVKKTISFKHFTAHGKKDFPPIFNKL